PAMLADLWFDLKYCLSPWSWSSVTGTGFSRAEELALALACAAVFVAAARILPRRTALARRDLMVTAAVGLTLAIASSPAYVIIEGARNLFRTQMVCGPGAALFLASAILLIKNWSQSRVRAGVIALVLTALIVFTGSQRAMERSAYYRAKWEPHR